MRTLKEFWTLLKEAASQWLDDKAPRLGAALAYYTVFSLAPLLVIVIAIVGALLGRKAVQGEIAYQMQDLVGEQGAKAVQEMIVNADQPHTSIPATAISILLLFFGAMGLFGQLQEAMNTIWEVEPKPGRWFMSFLRERLLSFSMVLGTAFLLLISLVINAVLSAVGGQLLGDNNTSLVGQLVNQLISFGVITLLFAMIYRFLPDAVIAWREVWLGAAITSLLFVIGKWLIGLYLGRASIGSVYGAAGSFAVLLVWVYYSAQIFLYGAEFTKAFANHYGRGIVPTPNAIRIRARVPVDQSTAQVAGLARD